MRIDKEFAKWIPPLTKDEYNALERSIVAEGCREKLIVWNDTLLDGHNRFQICSANNIDYKTTTIDLPNRQSALDWIVSNQLARRNLTPEQISYLRGKQYNRSKQRGGNTSNRQNVGLTLAEAHNVTPRTIERDAKFAEALDKVDAETRRQVLARESDLTKQQVIDLANHKPLVLQNTGNEEWYTPRQYLDSAKVVLGAIDLDPASCEYANKLVGATKYYTKDDDGLTREWSGRVWLNPPYTAGLVSKFTDKLVDSFQSGSVTEAIVLVNNATDTRWFQRLARGATLCLLDHRVKYISPTKTSSSPTQGQVIVYLGNNQQQFAKEFGKYGLVLTEYENTP